jgi:hypothetical protein
MTAGPGQRMRGGRPLWLMAAAFTASAPVILHAQDALTLSEILDLRRRGVPSRQILRTAQEYCIDFTVNDTVVRALVAVGGDTVLLSGIRQTCTVTSPLRLPPGVLVDDNFPTISGLAAFTAADGLCTAQPNGRGLRVENRRGSFGCGIEYPLELTETQVRVELTVAELEGKRDAMAALGFGKDNHSWDQYSFAITREGRYELCMSVSGKCQRLLFQKRIESGLAGDTLGTRIAVEIRGREVALYIEDARVGTYTAPHDVVGRISLSVGARSAAVFSRLRVVRLQGMAAQQ